MMQGFICVGILFYLMQSLVTEIIFKNEDPNFKTKQTIKMIKTVYTAINFKVLPKKKTLKFSTVGRVVKRNAITDYRLVVSNLSSLN